MYGKSGAGVLGGTGFAAWLIVDGAIYLSLILAAMVMTGIGFMGASIWRRNVNGRL